MLKEDRLLSFLIANVESICAILGSTSLLLPLAFLIPFLRSNIFVAFQWILPLFLLVEPFHAPSAANVNSAVAMKGGGFHDRYSFTLADAVNFRILADYDSHSIEEVTDHQTAAKNEDITRRRSKICGFFYLMHLMKDIYYKRTLNTRMLFNEAAGLSASLCVLFSRSFFMKAIQNDESKLYALGKLNIAGLNTPFRESCAQVSQYIPKKFIDFSYN